MTVLALPAYAKLNLTLEVVGVEPGGYHQLRSHMQAISLHDLLIAAPAERTTLTGGFPDDLVLRAASALERAAGRPLPARFELRKRIPAGAGMGGGSSDAATALVALARLHDLDVDLAPVAAEVGADVPFFLEGGSRLAEGRGERLRPAPLATGWFALACPGYGVSTGAVFRAWDEVGGEGSNHLARAAFRVESRLQAFAKALGEGWHMTGSGSGFFRPFATRAAARAACARLGCWTAVARPVEGAG